MIKFEFSVDETNHILSLLGRLPFADVNMTIMAIVDQGRPQAEALEAEQASKAKETAEE
jgi:hypothetical protein